MLERQEGEREVEVEPILLRLLLLLLRFEFDKFAIVSKVCHGGYLGTLIDRRDRMANVLEGLQ